MTTSLIQSRSIGLWPKRCCSRDETRVYTHDVDGSLLSINYNWTEYYYVTNLQGDVIELLDSQGNTVVLSPIKVL